MLCVDLRCYPQECSIVIRDFPQSLKERYIEPRTILSTQVNQETPWGLKGLFLSLKVDNALNFSLRKKRNERIKTKRFQMSNIIFTMEKRRAGGGGAITC